MTSHGESRNRRGGEPVVPRAAVGRLSLYLRQLEQFQKEGAATVSSRGLGQVLGISDAQVRKDLAYFGQFGQSGIGYRIEPLSEAIRHILGTDRQWPVALVGVGNLGRALVGYRGFRRQGFEIVAIFDLDPRKVGQLVEGVRVEHVTELAERVAHWKTVLGMIAVPAEAAQSVADQLVAGGVRGILSFAPTPLSVPKHVRLVSVDLAIQLESLSYLVQSSHASASA